MSQSIKLIGITGSIGSGKSLVTSIIGEQGFTVLNADLLGHQALKLAILKDKLCKIFGTEIIGSDNEIDRAILGSKVFADPDQLTKLNKTVHPVIRDLFIEKLENFKNSDTPLKKGLLFLEAAILIEASWHEKCDQVWVVWTDEQTAVNRVMARNNFSEAEVKKRLSSQLQSYERMKFANKIIENNASIELLKATVLKVLAEM